MVENNTTECRLTKDVQLLDRVDAGTNNNQKNGDIQMTIKKDNNEDVTLLRSELKQLIEDKEVQLKISETTNRKQEFILDNIESLMADQLELFLSLAETINFYSNELSATIEHQCLFNSLNEHYTNIHHNRAAIFKAFCGEVA